MFVIKDKRKGKPTKKERLQLLIDCCVEEKSLRRLNNLIDASSVTLHTDCKSFVDAGMMVYLGKKSVDGKRGACSHVFKTVKQIELTDDDLVMLMKVSAKYHYVSKNGGKRKYVEGAVYVPPPKTVTSTDAEGKPAYINGVMTVNGNDAYFAKKINETISEERKNRKQSKNHVSGATLEMIN